MVIMTMLVKRIDIEFSDPLIARVITSLAAPKAAAPSGAKAAILNA